MEPDDAVDAGGGVGDRAGGAAGSRRYVDVMEYRVSALPFDAEQDAEHHLWDVYVVFQGSDRWSVHRFFRSSRLNRLTGEWSREMRSSEREEEWVEAHSFTLEEALAAAAEQAGLITVNRLTAAEYAARRDEGQG